MLSFKPESLSAWAGTPWENGPPAGPVTGISIDTRTLQPGSLYVAIRGERFDGHDFLEQAFEKGAAGALVCADAPSVSFPLLRVPDTITGLQELARGYRGEWKGHVVGITGSVGKTTVKEMCAAILSVKAQVHRTEGNLNNHIGLPLSMLAMPPEAEYGVFEIGMNHPGEIGPLAKLLRPDTGIITDIGNAHRENFESLEAIASEKAQLAAQVPAEGRVILDRDSEWFELINDHTCAGVITISLGGAADYTGHASGASELTVKPQTPNLKPQTFPLPLPGKHIMQNALRAIALGLEAKMTPEEVAEGLRRVRLPSMRWEESSIAGIHFVNDAYNANPLSMQANLSTFAAQPGGGARWAVVGGMRELGDTSGAEHAALGRYIDGLGLDGVITVGELGGTIVCRNVSRFYPVTTAAEAAAILKEQLQPGDHVLLKASRGEKLEQVLELFKEN